MVLGGVGCGNAVNTVPVAAVAVAVESGAVAVDFDIESCILQNLHHQTLQFHS